MFLFYIDGYNDENSADPSFFYQCEKISEISSALVRSAESIKIRHPTNSIKPSQLVNYARNRLKKVH